MNKRYPNQTLTDTCIDELERLIERMKEYQEGEKEPPNKKHASVKRSISDAITILQEWNSVKSMDCYDPIKKEWIEI